MSRLWILACSLSSKNVAYDRPYGIDATSNGERCHTRRARSPSESQSSKNVAYDRPYGIDATSNGERCHTRRVRRPSLRAKATAKRHLPIFWSYWRYEARHRAGSDPCCEVCRRRARVGRAQSPPVGGGRVARYRLRRRRGGFVGHRSGSGDDSQGTPGDFPRRGADGPHPTPWRRKASHPAGSTRHRGRARSLGGSADARRPDLAAALDVQESREAGGGAERAGVAGEFDHCGPAAAPPGLPAAIAAQAAGRRHASGPQRAVRAHQPDRGRASDRRPAGDLGRHEEERAGRELQERRARMAAEGHAAGGAGA